VHLQGQKFAHVNSIAHEGKILVFGTTADGKIYYTVKGSGFEDTALQDNQDPLSFEPWKLLPLVQRANGKNLAVFDGNGLKYHYFITILRLILLQKNINQIGN